MIKKILNYTMFLICMMTILTYDVNAMTVQNDLGITLPPSTKLYNNVGGTLTQKDYYLEAGNNDSQSDSWLYNSTDMSLIGKGNGVVIASLANGLLPGHEYFLTMYFALSNNYNISYGYEPSATRYFGVTSSLYQVPKNDIIPSHNGYFPTSQYVTNSAYSSYPYLASFYVRFVIPNDYVGALGFYISLSSSTTINFGYSNIAYLGYDLVDTTTLTTSQKTTLNAIYENTQNLSTAEVREAIEELNATQNITNNKIDETNSQLNDLNNNLNDSDTSDATNEADDFFSGFSTDTFGLTSIITAPLNLIGSITSSSCSPLGLQVPFLDNTTLNLPCMSTIYRNHFGSFLSVYQTITFGIVAYWVCVRIFALVKDFKNPDHDEIEVLDL